MNQQTVGQKVTGRPLGQGPEGRVIRSGCVRACAPECAWGECLTRVRASVCACVGGACASCTDVGSSEAVDPYPKTHSPFRRGEGGAAPGPGTDSSDRVLKA